MSAGGFAKSGLGVVLVVAGLLVVSGADKRLETALVDVMPEWLTQLTTRY